MSQSQDTRVALTSRSISRPSFDEVYLTANAVAVTEPTGFFAAIAAQVAAQGLQVVGEKIYGVRGARLRLLEERASAYAASKASAQLMTAPVTFVDGRPIGDGAELAGVQLWALRPKTEAAPRVTHVQPEGLGGSVIAGDALRWLYLAAIDSADGGGEATAQASEMFGRAARALRAHDLHYAQVARTWIYCARLLDWYDGLNAARAEHHQRVGLGRDAEGEIPPASTGIQGAGREGRECMMDLLAVESGATPIRRSSRQDSAFAYGSSFSRGMRLEAEGRATIHVSGTASIGERGLSIYRDDAEAQSLATLLAIGGLLADHGAALHDICSATVFCKTPAVHRAFEDVCRLLELPRLPSICVVADVCRPELLIEIEAVASP